MTVECLKNALALIENYFGRPLSTDERTARSQIYAAALKDIPDDVAAAALTKALTVCRYQNQLLVDWCAEIRKLQSSGQPTANDLWTQAIVAARKIERNQYYATHGGLVTATGKLTAEDFRAENRSIFGALPAAVREWAGSPAGLVDALDRSNADLLQYVTRTYYDAQGETFCALDHAALIWEQGHSIAIMGESGSGKSTLARLMIGLERPSEGRILINGVDTTKWSLREWRKYRGKIQAVFQDAGGTLNPAWSTSKNVEEALVNLTDLSPSQRKNRIAELMEQTGLSKNLLDTPVRRLSGGEQRRLALLRSLSISPEFLILDEVTAGLDLISTEAVLQLLEKYEQEHDCAYLVITHDLQIASRLCEVIYEIEHGKITKKAVR